MFLSKFCTMKLSDVLHASNTIVSNKRLAVLLHEKLSFRRRLGNASLLESGRDIISHWDIKHSGAQIKGKHLVRIINLCASITITVVLKIFVSRFCLEQDRINLLMFSLIYSFCIANELNSSQPQFFLGLDILVACNSISAIKKANKCLSISSFISKIAFNCIIF